MARIGAALLAAAAAAQWCGARGLLPALVPVSARQETQPSVSCVGARCVAVAIDTVDRHLVVSLSSSDSGATWSAPVKVSDGLGSLRVAPLAGVGRRALQDGENRTWPQVSCIENSTSCATIWTEKDGFELKVSRSGDLGASWSDPRMVDVSQRGALNALSLACFAPGTCVAAMAAVQQSAVLMLRSADGGAHWDGGVVVGGPGVATGGVAASEPSVSCTSSGSLCALAFTGAAVGATAGAGASAALTARSLDGGQLWSTPRAVSASIFAEGSVRTPAVACPDTAGCVLVTGVVRTPNSNPEPRVAFSRSQDGGATFEQLQELAFDPVAGRTTPVLSCESGGQRRCVAAWQVSLDANPAPMVALSADLGRTWRVDRVAVSQAGPYGTLALSCAAATGACTLLAQQGSTAGMPLVVAAGIPLSAAFPSTASPTGAPTLPLLAPSPPSPPPPPPPPGPAPVAQQPAVAAAGADSRLTVGAVVGSGAVIGAGFYVYLLRAAQRGRADLVAVHHHGDDRTSKSSEGSTGAASTASLTIAAANALRTSALTAASSIVFVFTGHAPAEQQARLSPGGRQLGDMDKETGLPVVILQVPSVDLRANRQLRKPLPDV
jgi:hypothetical protein